MNREMHPTRWGNPAAAAALPAETRGFVENALGIRDTPAIAKATVPASGLSPELIEDLRELLGAQHIHTRDELRQLRTRGKSTPDLLRARSGDLTDAPDVVAQPATHGDVEALIEFAIRHHVALVPFGGGTSVTGGLVADRDDYAGVVSVDMARMKSVRDIDTVSMTAVLEPGLRGPEVEAALAEYDLMLGHYPQSFEYASVGGFTATRSSGQASAGYGRFDSMVVGLTVATPQGTWELGTAPASGAGPDLRQLILGSEGAFGIITSVRVRVKPLPEERVYEAWQFDSFAEGTDAMRYLAQHQLMPTVCRLSDEFETMFNLAGQSHIDDDASGGCLMIVGYEGASVAEKRAQVSEALSKGDGTALGQPRGIAWEKGRFHGPYLRDSLLDVGVLVETLETATFWSNVEHVYSAVQEALSEDIGEQGFILCHISHIYETGCALYFTVAVSGFEEPLDQWRAAKARVSQAIIDAGATITHHHAVGTDHKPWYAQEIGPVGTSILRAIKTELDPTGVLNPGVLIP